MGTDDPPWAGLKVALVHDWFQGFHGSERVVDALATGVLREAGSVDVFTFHAAKELLPKRLASRIVAESKLAALPGLRQEGHDPGRWRYLLPLMPRYFKSLDLSGYGLVVASSHAVSHHVRPPEETPFVCYCHSPMRYAWVPQVDAGRGGGAGRVALRATAPWLRRIDRSAAQRPGSYVAVSSAVRERIERFYGRSAEVVHPPVEVDDFAPTGARDPRRFLWVSRLVSYKRPEAVIEAFRDLPYELTMVGVGPLEEELRAALPANVRIMGWLGRSELAALFATATGFIHVGEEDFGISMAESLAAGTPVVALARGGAPDIVRDGLDGILIDSPEPGPIRDAVARVAETTWDREDLIARARTFSRSEFESRMRALLEREFPGH
jgi:glycosyltransferase involved in cell wall biosynthesis